MYLKIIGQLIDVLGEKARGDIRTEFGIEVSPAYQFLDRNPSVSLARVVDQVKAEPLTHDDRITLLSTVAAVNAEIDALYQERYALADSTAMMLDLQLSGRTAASIPGYDTAKSMTDQANLKALYQAGVSGIRVNQKPPYITE